MKKTTPSRKSGKGKVTPKTLPNVSLPDNVSFKESIIRLMQTPKQLAKAK